MFMVLDNFPNCWVRVRQCGWLRWRPVSLGLHAVLDIIQTRYDLWRAKRGNLEQTWQPDSLFHFPGEQKSKRCEPQCIFVLGHQPTDPIHHISIFYIYVTIALKMYKRFYQYDGVFFLLQTFFIPNSFFHFYFKIFYYLIS